MKSKKKNGDKINFIINNTLINYSLYTYKSEVFCHTFTASISRLNRLIDRQKLLPICNEDNVLNSLDSLFLLCQRLRGSKNLYACMKGAEIVF